MSDRLSEILSSAIAPGKTEWVDTGLTTESLRAAIEHVRSDTSYAPSCGTPDRPHVFHPLEHERLLPPEEFPQSYFAAQGWAFCANCGMPWPLRAKETDDHA